MVHPALQIGLSINMITICSDWRCERLLSAHQLTKGNIMNISNSSTVKAAVLALSALASYSVAAKAEPWFKQSIYKGQYTELNTCTQTYPSYWQDPNPKFTKMWEGQTISNVPTSLWDEGVFALSDKYPRELVVEPKKNQPWYNAKFDALFDESTSQREKSKLAKEYIKLVYAYGLEGNVMGKGRIASRDFDTCENKYRPWFHIPFQTYDPLSGREYIRGLTREAPVTFSVQDSSGTDASTMWAVGFYNATAAYTLGEVWQEDGTAKLPKEGLRFQEGAVIIKPLFNTSTVAQIPVLEGLPSWNANISDPAYCECKVTPGSKDKDGNERKECNFIEESEQCKRNSQAWDDVKLLQFDVAVRDDRAKDTGWVYGTFVADGQRKENVKNPWEKMTWLGLMWGNDTPTEGHLAFNTPVNPRKNGFSEAVINWSLVDELNKYSGSAMTRQVGHLGCNNRLNGPADNTNSSCMSCHGTASLPDSERNTPQMISQFGKQTPECAVPLINSATLGKDRGGDTGKIHDGINFAQIDSLYFANTGAGESFNIRVNGKSLAQPNYEFAPNKKEWISLDYSMQLSISLQQWLEWVENQKLDPKDHVLKDFRGRN